MKKTNSKRDNFNLFISAFLIIAYIVCAFFFIDFANTQTGIAQSIITSLVTILFGGILFYATRVGEGQIVTRFSVFTLIFLDIPALFLVLVYVFQIMPISQFLAGNDFVFTMACVALGYGIPYTFISGFESTAQPEIEEVVSEESEEDVLDTFDIEENEETEENEEVVEEIIVEDEETVVENTEETQDVEEVSEETEDTEEVSEETEQSTQE